MNLTPREYEIARLLALGKSWKEITAELGISRATLWFHRASALHKADTDTMQGVWARLGWLNVPDMRAPDSGAAGHSPQVHRQAVLP